MGKQAVIAMRLDPAHVIVDMPGEFKKRVSIGKPPGCIGVCFVFESKKAARAWYGSDVDLLAIYKPKKRGEKK